MYLAEKIDTGELFEFSWSHDDKLIIEGLEVDDSLYSIIEQV